MTNFTDEGTQSVGDEINESDVNNGGARTRGMGVETGLTETDTSTESKGESARQPTQAETLIELASEMVLFRSSDGEDYASFQNEGHKKTLLIKSKDFKDYLAALFCGLKGKPPHSNALQSALAVLRGRASMNPWRQPVYSRLAQMGSNVYLNLADDRWRVVEVTPSGSGWEVVSDHPVFFLKPKGMAALPVPERGWCVSDV